MCPDENNKNFAELFKLHAEGKINPEVSQKYTLENSADAFLHLANRKAKGKVIINM
jgi:NADPH2:quinone reductase